MRTIQKMTGHRALSEQRDGRHSIAPTVQTLSDILFAQAKALHVSGLQAQCFAVLADFRLHRIQRTQL